MSKRRHKPTDPEAVRLAKRSQALAAVGMQPEAAGLPQHDAVETTRMGEERETGNKKAGHDVAKRVDAFLALRDGMEVGCYDACRRFEREVLESLKQADRGPRTERVDCDDGRDKEFRFIASAVSVAKVRQRLAERDFWLLSELVSPSIEGETWRQTVGRITGEENWNVQGGIIRHVSVSLREAYDALDRPKAA